MDVNSLGSIIEKLKKLQPSLHDRYGVSGLWIFGSWALGEQRPTSDLDMLVEFDRPGMTLLKFIDLEMVLSEALGVTVDLVQRSAIKPNLRSRIIGEAVAV